LNNFPWGFSRTVSLNSKVDWCKMLYNFDARKLKLHNMVTVNVSNEIYSSFLDLKIFEQIPLGAVSMYRMVTLSKRTPKLTCEKDQTVSLNIEHTY
jgi:hypothetical protein